MRQKHKYAAENFPEKLKRLRSAKGESQVEAAKELQISKSSYAAYEVGARVPRDDVKKRIAKHFDTCVQDIFFS